MGLTITTAAAPKPGRTAVPVPDEVASDLAGLRDHLAANPGELAVASFDNEAERNQFVLQLRTWADQNGLIARKVKGGDSEPTQYVFRLLHPDEIEARKAARQAAEQEREAKKANGEQPKRGRPRKAS